MPLPFCSWKSLAGSFGSKKLFSQRKRSSQRSARRTRPLRFESLEERTLLATLYWVADGAPGNWNDADNWSATAGGMGGADVPDADDTATFLENANINTVAMGHTVQHMNVGADVIMNADLTVNEKLTVGGTQAGRLGISADKTMTVGYAVIGSDGRTYVAGSANLNVTSAIPGTPDPPFTSGDAIQLENGGVLAVRGTVNAGDREIELGLTAGGGDMITDHYFGGVLPGFTFTGGVGRVNAGKMNSHGFLDGDIDVGATKVKWFEGAIRPGHSPGVITIEGDYEQQSSATLEIELGGTLAAEEYDVLDVYGTATLAGTLDVSLINSFTPSLNDSFYILPASNVVGEFDGIPEGIQSSSSPLPSLPSGLAWDVSYSGGVALHVVAESSLPVVTISDAEADESAGTMVFDVSLSEASSQDVTVYYETSDGNGTYPATGGIDYTEVASGWVVIPAGQYSTTIEISIIDDTEVESGDPETFQVRLTSADNATVGQYDVGVGAIVDNDYEQYLTLDLPPIANSDAAHLTGAQVKPLAEEAARRWSLVGANPSQLRTILATVDIRITDLPGSRLGAAGHNRVLLDVDAAGYGWFIDSSPSDDREFQEIIGGSELQATAGSAAVGKVDLLTVVMHEFGHLLGLPDLPAAVFPHHIMTETIGLGTRRTPDSLSHRVDPHVPSAQPPHVFFETIRMGLSSADISKTTAGKSSVHWTGHWPTKNRTGTRWPTRSSTKKQPSNEF